MSGDPARCQPACGEERVYTLGGLGIAPNNQLMAVAEDYLSRRQYGLRFATSATASGTRKSSKCHLRLCLEQRFTLCLVCA